MFADLLSSFLQSPHGESAATLLQDRHGLSADQASEALGHAGEAAAAPDGMIAAFSVVPVEPPSSP